jgi:hypothetical protein
VREFGGVSFPFGIRRNGFSGDAGEFLKKDFITGLIVDIVDIDIPDDAVLINNENSPFTMTFMPENAVFLCNLAVGPEVAE